MTESLLSAEEIRDRHQAVRSNGYPREEVRLLIEGLLRSKGPDAEAAVLDLIGNIQYEELMSALVRRHVMLEAPLRSSYADYADTHCHDVLDKLIARGFKPCEDGTGIHVRIPAGKVIDEVWKVNNGRRRGQTICSAALKAVALQTIWSPAPER